MNDVEFAIVKHSIYELLRPGFTGVLAFGRFSCLPPFGPNGSFPLRLNLGNLETGRCCSASCNCTATARIPNYTGLHRRIKNHVVLKVAVSVRPSKENQRINSRISILHPYMYSTHKISLRVSPECARSGHCAGFILKSARYGSITNKQKIIIS